MHPDPLDERLARLASATADVRPPADLVPRILEALAQRSAPQRAWDTAWPVFRRLFLPAAALALIALALALWQDARMTNALAVSPEAAPELAWSLDP